MPITPRERLARVLDGSQAPGAFSAQLSVPARDVRLTVAGAGPISFPVKAPQAKRMIATARPARFGRGEQTLMDLSVRDTWEITPDQVTLTGLDWDTILAEVRDGLGLPPRARLRAEPHALLVYGKGQFFLPHQDSEKDDTMLGTLVVSLPSSHTGGELLIEHNDKTVAYQAARAEASPSWVLTELRARLDAGDLVNARTAAESVAPFWKAPGPGLLEPALTTAARLEDPGIALMLLRPFAVEWLTPAHAGGLAALATRYGESWHRNLLDAWFGSRNTWRYTGDVDHQGWDAALPGLTAALRDAGAAATAGWLLAASWGWLDDEIRLWLRYPSAATRRKQLAELGKPLAGLLAAADGTALVGEIVTVLREHGDNVLGCLLPMLRAAGPGPSAPLDELARDCERRLTAITERPARAHDDWSVPWSSGCGCELCGSLGEFLADRGERTLEWPLAEARRKHVKGQISAGELPVKHEIWKFGSPHTLVLTKTDELFRREAKARKDAAASLEWLAAQRRRYALLEQDEDPEVPSAPGTGLD